MDYQFISCWVRVLNVHVTNTHYKRGKKKRLPSENVE